jgi:hypothetical protein
VLVLRKGPPNSINVSSTPPHISSPHRRLTCTPNPSVRTAVHATLSLSTAPRRLARTTARTKPIERRSTSCDWERPGRSMPMGGVGSALTSRASCPLSSALAHRVEGRTDDSIAAAPTRTMAPEPVPTPPILSEETRPPLTSNDSSKAAAAVIEGGGESSCGTGPPAQD